jgi:hypothetical protein
LRSITSGTAKVRDFEDAVNIRPLREAFYR